MNAAVHHLAHGPFAGRVDPWAEDAHYFSQLHSGIIAAALSQLWEPLLSLGYIASKEASVQIAVMQAPMRKPDIAVRSQHDPPAERPLSRLDYSAAASQIMAEPGIVLELAEPELQSIAIRHGETGALVTIIEVISPRNKTHAQDVAQYRDDRQALFLARGVNVVEIDLTRSARRLLDHPHAGSSPYHTAVFIPDEAIHYIGLDYGAPLKRIAVPLRGEVIGLELQAAYDRAYLEATVAPQIERNGHYAEAFLPFPSLLTDAQRAEAIAAVAAWKSDLVRLREEGV